MAEAEARRGEAFRASAFGRRRIYRNECAGFYYPFLPADEYFDRGHFPWFADIEAQTPTIRADLPALLDDPGETLRPYLRLEAGTPVTIWSALDNKLDWGAWHQWASGMSNPPVLHRRPRTYSAPPSLPGVPNP